MADFNCHHPEQMAASEQAVIAVRSETLRIHLTRGLTASKVIYCFEPLLGTALIAVTAPALIVAGALTIVLSRRSPFVAHLRVGTAGDSFWMWKLRTMWRDSTPREGSWRIVERITEAEIPENKSDPDPRIISRFAAFCRKYSIDELPQLFHVAVGQMSLVGPRPITRKELDEHYGSRAEEVLRMRPGITGLWQVSGRNALTYEERCRMDLALVRGFSLRLYVSILLRTIPKLVTGTGSH